MTFSSAILQISGAADVLKFRLCSVKELLLFAPQVSKLYALEVQTVVAIDRSLVLTPKYWPFPSTSKGTLTLLSLCSLPLIELGDVTTVLNEYAREFSKFAEWLETFPANIGNGTIIDWPSDFPVKEVPEGNECVLKKILSTQKIIQDQHRNGQKFIRNALLLPTLQVHKKVVTLNEEGIPFPLNSGKEVNDFFSTKYNRARALQWFKNRNVPKYQGIAVKAIYDLLLSEEGKANSFWTGVGSNVLSHDSQEAFIDIAIAKTVLPKGAKPFKRSEYFCRFRQCFWRFGRNRGK